MHQTGTYRVESSMAPLTQFVTAGIIGIDDQNQGTENSVQSATAIFSLPACVVNEALPELVRAHRRRR
jgi:hypothetical protein